MCLWAIVPVKPLRRGKSRLAQVMSVEEREQLNNEMLGHTIETLRSVSGIDEVLVISRDQAALALARDHKARTLQEESNAELNKVLQRATMVAKAYSACGVLVLPADLPLVTPRDIRTFLNFGGNPPEVVIAPDRNRRGTNALLVSPIGLVRYSFGPESFQAHLREARKTSARVHVCELENLALDLDTPEDLDYLKNLQYPQEILTAHFG